jgi:multicomponent Na+:H+ antiporter subunit D
MNVEWILSPGLPLIAGGLLLPLFRGTARSVWSLVVPVASAFLLAAFPQGDSGHLTLFGSVLTVVRVDKLSLIFGYAFHLAAFLAALYAFHDRGSLEKSAGLVYAGSTIGAAFAGDLITLFVFWELTAVSSVFVIWARGTDAARAAGFRYLVMQIVSGLLLLGGMALLAGEGRGLAFGRMELAGPAAWLVFLAFGVKCAFPLLHGWLKDAYPEASPTGTVFLSAFTTKLAVYCLARAWPWLFSPRFSPSWRTT